MADIVRIMDSGAINYVGNALGSAFNAIFFLAAAAVISAVVLFIICIGMGIYIYVN